METLPSWLWWWAALCGILGGAVGSKKGRLILGFIFGFLAGPIGIGIILLLKGNRIACPQCMERIHKDASICPQCRTEVMAGYGEVPSGNRFAMSFAILSISIVLGVGSWVLVGANSRLRPTGSSYASGRPQAVHLVTRSQFARLRKNMLYREVVEILGSRGERATEIKLSDYVSLVTFRWANPDGSMVVIDFKKVVGVNEDWGLLADSISSVGLTE